MNIQISRDLAERLATMALWPERTSKGIQDELRALLAAPVVERQEPVACNHEWRDMASAPRDGTLLRLLVEFNEHSTKDDDQAPTIGANNFDNDEQDEWLFAGWCWTHDRWVQGKGTPVGWLPMIDTSPPAPVAVVLPERLPMRSPEDRNLPKGHAKGWNACLDRVKELNQ